MLLIIIDRISMIEIVLKFISLDNNIYGNWKDFKNNIDAITLIIGARAGSLKKDPLNLPQNKILGLRLN